VSARPRPNAVVHEVFGALDREGAQRCVLCGRVVAENGERVAVAMPTGSAPPKPLPWATGSVTEWEGGAMWTAGAEPGAPACTKLRPQ
jgi:hypothetical protein